MNDEEIETVLSRYRPAGPPADLEARILGGAREPRVWPWASAAAALFACSFLLQGSATAELRGAYVPREDPMSTEVEQLTVLFGGTTEARAIAETVTWHERVRAARAETSAPGAQ